MEGGFTLIEVVAALAIAALVCMAVAAAGTAALSQRRSAEAWSDVRIELRGGAARMWSAVEGEDGIRTGPPASNDWISIEGWTPRSGNEAGWTWQKIAVRPPGEPDRGTTITLPVTGGRLAENEEDPSEPIPTVPPAG